jgi:hypothetical protein
MLMELEVEIEDGQAGTADSSAKPRVRLCKLFTSNTSDVGIVVINLKRGQEIRSHSARTTNSSLDKFSLRWSASSQAGSGSTCCSIQAPSVSRATPPTASGKHALGLVHRDGEF